MTFCQGRDGLRTEWRQLESITSQVTTLVNIYLLYLEGTSYLTPYSYDLRS